MKSMASLPEYLRKAGYKNPQNQEDGPVQYGLGIDKVNMFTYMMANNPKLLGSFQTFFEADRGSRPAWVDWFPVQQKLLDDPTKPVKEDNILYVDIAGGRGHDLLVFKDRFPQYPGRYVLQDLPGIVNDQTLKLGDRVEKVGFNFFEDQAISGMCILVIVVISADMRGRCSALLHEVYYARLVGREMPHHTQERNCVHEERLFYPGHRGLYPSG
jgi:hypothetical protein